MPSDYEYDDEDDGMRSALERARGTAGPDDSGQPMVLPEMDFTGDDSDTPAQPDVASGMPPQETAASHSARKQAEFEEEGDYAPHTFALKEAPAVHAARKQAEFAEEGDDAPHSFALKAKAPQANDEYTSALAKLKGILSKPTRDYSQGYGEAQKQDESENRTNRILDYLSQGLRRASSADLTPAATHASDFLKRQGLDQQRDAGELSRVGHLASMLKPAKASGKDPGSVDGLRAYLVKVGAGSPEEFAGMSEAQLKAAASMFGLKHKLSEDTSQADMNERRFAETQRHNKETEGAAWRAANRAENDKPLAPTSISDIADFDVADKALGQLEDDFKSLGMSGWQAKVSGKATEALGLTGTDAAVYLNKAKQAQQVVGKILEGGKLAQGDEAKYKGLIPQPGDSDKLLASKVSGLRSFLGDMKAGRIKLYKEGGYKTPGGSGGGKTVNVKFPNGSVVPVPEADVEEARTKYKGEVVGG